MRGTFLAAVMIAGLVGFVDLGVARAGGTEFPAAGTRALARGGAFYARADDPMTLLYNPANLAGMTGIQLSLQAHLAFYSGCQDRAGTYSQYPSTPAAETDSRFQRNTIDPNFYNSSAFNGFDENTGQPINYPMNVEMPEVCNSGPPGIVPELVLTWRAHRMVGIGIGLVAPAGVGHTVWGEDATINGRTYRGVVNLPNGGRLPAPTRYNLIEEQLIIAYPTIGIGVAPHPKIRFGASFGFGFGLFDFVNVTRATRGEEFSGDILTELSATDAFIPRVSASIHAVPHDSIDIMVGFTWTDSIRATGDLKLQSEYYRDEVLDELTIDGVELTAPQPWQLAFGIRYSDRIAPRPTDPNQVSRLTGRVEDQMANERFDIEFNMVYERNSLVDAFNVVIPRNGPGTEGTYIIQAAQNVPASIPPDLQLAHNWQDQFSFRLGGSYNVMPGLASVHLGGSFETNGVESGFEQLDFIAFKRFGLSAGLTMRVGRLDISLAYSHIHQFAQTTGPEESKLRAVTAEQRLADLCAEGRGLEGCSESSSFGPGTLINIGRITSHFNVVSLGLNYHFQ